MSYSQVGSGRKSAWRDGSTGRLELEGLLEEVAVAGLTASANPLPQKLDGFVPGVFGGVFVVNRARGGGPAVIRGGVRSDVDKLEIIEYDFTR